MKKMIRTFHPVGHGAFYTERFYDEQGKPIFTAVFDCGCYEAAKAGRCSHVYEERIKNEIHQTFVKDDKINVLFISHLHTDHINGVMELLAYCTVEKIILPALERGVIAEAVLYNYINGIDLNSSDTFMFIDKLFDNSLEAKIISVTTGESLIGNRENNIEQINDTEIGSGTILNCNRIWSYIPINIGSQNAQNIINDIERAAGLNQGYICANNNVDYEKIKQAVEKIGIKKCKEIYKAYYGDYHNSYSMVVFSCKKECFNENCIKTCHRKGEIPINCFLNGLYMGDFEANPTHPKKNDNFKSLQDIYEKIKLNYLRIGVLQVPHHGSCHNLNKQLYKTSKLCIISAESDDKYGHPDQIVLDTIHKERSIPIIVTENPKTTLQFTYDLK